MEKICDIDLIINKEKEKLSIISYNLYTIVPSKLTDIVFPLFIFNKFADKRTIERAKTKLSKISGNSLSIDDLAVIEFRNKDIRFEIPDSNKTEVFQSCSYSFPLVAKIKELEKYEKFVKYFIVHSSTYGIYNNLSEYGCNGRQLFPGVSYYFSFTRNSSNIDISNYTCFRDYNLRVQQGQEIGKILEDNPETRINKPGHVYFSRNWSIPRIYLGSVKVSSRFKRIWKYNVGFFFDEFYRCYSENCSQSSGKPRDYFINLECSLGSSIEDYLKTAKGKSIGEAISIILDNCPITDALNYYSGPEKAVDLGKLLVVNNKSDNPEDIIYQKIKDSFDSGKEDKRVYRYLGVIDNKDFLNNKKQWNRLIKFMKNSVTPDKIDELYSKDYKDIFDDNIIVCREFIDLFGYTKDEFKKLIKI